MIGYVENALLVTPEVVELTPSGHVHLALDFGAGERIRIDFQSFVHPNMIADSLDEVSARVRGLARPVDAEEPPIASSERRARA